MALIFFRFSQAVEEWFKFTTLWQALAINTLMLFSENSESLIISWSVWMKQGAEEDSNIHILTFMLNALSRRKTWKRSMGIPLFSSIFFMFSLILKQVWEPSISLQCKARCLYWKHSSNKCVVKERYDVFVFELVHMSLVNVKILVTKTRNFRLTVHNFYSRGYMYTAKGWIN